MDWFAYATRSNSRSISWDISSNTSFFITHAGTLELLTSMNQPTRGREKLLSDLQSDAFKYFVNEVNLDNGLVVDCTKEGWPSSIAAVGMALSSYPVGVERNLITREEAIERTLQTLRFFAASEEVLSQA